MTLEELLTEAEKYGNVRLSGFDDQEAPNCYRAVIEFNTVNHVKLQATSEFGMTAKEALKMAIKNAVLVVESVGGIKCDSSEDVIRRLEG